MYGIIRALVGERHAPIVAAVCYALMAVAIAYAIFEPQADFKYIGL
jgi:hypothetical protein